MLNSLIVKRVLVLGEDLTQELYDKTLTAEKSYSINFTENNKKFCLSWHYNGTKSYLFVDGTEIHKFKAKDSKIVANLLFLGNVSINFSVDNMQKSELNGYVYDFSVDYDAIAVDDILDIHKCLMKKNNIKCLDLLKNVVVVGFFIFFYFYSNDIFWLQCTKIRFNE